MFVLGLSWVLSCDSVYPYLSQKMPGRESLISFVLPVYICLFPIVVAIVTVVYQLHCTRYTLEDFQDDIKARFWGVFLLSILGFVTTAIFWISGSSAGFFYFCSLITLAVLFYKTISFVVNLNSISIDGYVKKFKNRCIKKLKKENNLVDYLEKCTKTIEHYFIESVERKESNYINCIINAKVEIFKEYVCKINSLLLNESLKRADNERILDIFAKSLTNSFICLSENNVAKSLKNAYASSYVDICDSCIECQNRILFEALVDELSGNAVNLEIEDYQEVLGMMLSIQKRALKNEKEEYAEIVEKYFIRNIMSYRFNEKCKSNKVILAISCQILQNRISYSSEKSFEALFISFIDAIIDASENFDANDALFFSYLITNTQKKLEQKNFEKSFTCFLGGLKRIIRRAIIRKNNFVVQIVGYDYTNVIKSKLNKGSYITDTEILLFCLRKYPSEVFTFIPDYCKWIEENPSIEALRKILDLFNEIVECIDKKENVTVLTFFVNITNEILSLYCQKEQTDEEKIIAIVEWYQETVLGCIQNNENLACDIAISMFYRMFKIIIKQDAISDIIAEKILIFFDKIGIRLIETNDYNLQRKIIGIVYEVLPDEMNYCKKNAKGIMRISDIIFHFIIDSLQSGNMETLKTCSNALGWYALSLSKIGVLECYKKTIDYAFLMIELAICQKCDDRTILFLGTLVVVLGTYSNIHGLSEYETYLVEKVNRSEKTIQDIIAASKKFRYYEAAYWNDLLEGDARSGMDEFMKKLESIKVPSQK